MLDVFGYIFSSLESAERAIRTQNRINRNLVVGTVAIAVFAIAQAKKISHLEDEIKELKRKRGE